LNDAAHYIDAERERLLLGTLLHGGGQVPEKLSVDDFGVEVHRQIWLSISRVAPEVEVNIGSVAADLTEHHKLESIGGMAVLMDLHAAGAPGMPLDGFVRTLKEKSAIRRISQRATQIDKQIATYGLNGNTEAVIRAAREIIELAEHPDRPSLNQRGSSREFVALGDERYKFTLPDFGVSFDIDRVRRERNDLVGELCVHCELPGTRAVDGVLSIADFNVSSARARSERIRLLTERANVQGLDWFALTEEFCQRVLEANRAGLPAVDLRELPRPEQHDDIEIDRLFFPRRHPTMIFGDGGTAKSYTGLYVAGKLAQQGMAVALFDWELAGEDHRDRLERIFGKQMPRILYARCERPLVFEVDRLRRIVRDNRVEYTIYDSVAFACDGPPESAEVAGRYFRAVRTIGGGSLHIAHISKGENADKKPFGSAFWHNGARSTWYVKLAEASSDNEVLNVGFFNRKSNLGRLRAPAGFTITFTEDRTMFARAEVADTPDLAGQLSIRQRMIHLLRRGSMAPEAIAEEIEADLETVKRTARRYKKLFTVIEGGRLGLLERTAS
jgi:hypothetical protein